jgi:Transposase DDE domain
MPKKHKRDKRIQGADRQRRTNLPSPPVEEIQRELMRQLTPAMFAQARAGHSHLNLRDRVLNLSTMCAIVVSLVWRRVPSLSEVLRILSKEGLLWVEATEVSLTALSKRFDKLPAELFATLFEQLIDAQVKHRRLASEAATAPTAAHPLAVLQQIYSCLWIADASTLERLRKTTTELRQQPKAVLGGKLLMIVEALTHQPVCAFFEPDAAANEKRFCDRIVAALAVGGLVIIDAGFFSFAFFDAFTDAGKFFLTRMKANTRYQSIKVLSQGAHFRDEIINVGLNSGHPCQHRLRMVSVLWGTTWYRYLTNELDPTRLTAQQVAALYRQRWRIEDAFLLTKRLLGLAYLWVSSANGIEMQIYATLIFYSVLIALCNDLATALDTPLDRISVEMVFRSLYHFSRAVERDPSTELIPFLSENATLFALVKVERKRHRQRDDQLAEIWADA